MAQPQPPERPGKLMGRTKSLGRENFTQVHLNFGDGDIELLNYLVEYFKSNRTDVLRTAVRALAASVQAIDKKRGM